MSPTRITAAFIALTSGIACKTETAQQPPAARGAPSAADPVTPPTPAPTPAPPVSGLTDPQIAAIVVAANQIDIAAGQQAVKKTKNPEVTKLAEHMIADHTAANQAAGDLATKLKITPEPTDTSKALSSSGSQSLAQFAKLEGDAFNKAYVDNEVEFHKKVINMLDNQLLAAATNSELKAMLAGAKPTFEAHLKHAEQVAAELGRAQTH